MLSWQTFAINVSAEVCAQLTEVPVPKVRRYIYIYRFVCLCTNIFIIYMRAAVGGSNKSSELGAVAVCQGYTFN